MTLTDEQARLAAARLYREALKVYWDELSIESQQAALSLVRVLARRLPPYDEPASRAGFSVFLLWMGDEK